MLEARDKQEVAREQDAYNDIPEVLTVGNATVVRLTQEWVAEKQGAKESFMEMRTSNNCNTRMLNKLPTRIRKSPTAYR